MIIKWKTSRWHDARIERVECTRETKQTVWFMEERFSIGGRIAPAEKKSAKDGDRSKYHDSWEAAHAELLFQAEGAVFDARRAIERANSTLGNVKGMKKPETA